MIHHFFTFKVGVNTPLNASSISKENKTYCHNCYGVKKKPIILKTTFFLFFSIGMVVENLVIIVM